MLITRDGWKSRRPMKTILMVEVWVKIPKYEDTHEVSNFGNVRSITRLIKYQRWDGHNSFKTVNGKKLRLSFNKQNGYLMISLFGKTQYIHRLVAITFHKNEKQYPAVNHIDGNKTNNKPSNLEWCSHAQNAKHAYNNGLNKTPQQRGFSDKPNRKLSDLDIYEIRNTPNRDYEFLAEKYHVSSVTIRNVIKQKTFKNYDMRN
jgi:hypothetical protein